MGIPDLEHCVTYLQVSAGARHTVLLRSDGLFMICGDNGHGQCEMPIMTDGVGHLHSLPDVIQEREFFNDDCAPNSILLEQSQKQITQAPSHRSLPDNIWDEQDSCVKDDAKDRKEAPSKKHNLGKCMGQALKDRR